LVVLLMVAACDPAKDKQKAMTECQFEVQKMYPAADVSPFAVLTPAIKDALALCMKTKGFERDASPKDCRMFNVELQPACYR
jgi:hypothetical protein